AGTSQAAAQVSGLVAAMKAERPDMTAVEARAFLTDTARERHELFLSEDSGRGSVNAPATLRAAEHRRNVHRNRFFAHPIVPLQDFGTPTRAVAEVEILDKDGEPSRFTFVFGTFTGGAFATQVGFTGFDGIARFVSPPLSSGVVAFEVDAVAAFRAA